MGEPISPNSFLDTTRLHRWLPSVRAFGARAIDSSSIENGGAQCRFLFAPSALGRSIRRRSRMEVRSADFCARLRRSGDRFLVDREWRFAVPTSVRAFGARAIDSSCDREM